MKNKQQLKNAILLLLALSLIAVYIYSKSQTRTPRADTQVIDIQNTPVENVAPSEQVDPTISTPTPKAATDGGIPAPKPNQ